MQAEAWQRRAEELEAELQDANRQLHKYQEELSGLRAQLQDSKQSNAQDRDTSDLLREISALREHNRQLQQQAQQHEQEKQQPQQQAQASGSSQSLPSLRHLLDSNQQLREKVQLAEREARVAEQRAQAAEEKLRSAEARVASSSAAGPAAAIAAAGKTEASSPSMSAITRENVRLRAELDLVKQQLEACKQQLVDHERRATSARAGSSGAYAAAAGGSPGGLSPGRRASRALLGTSREALGPSHVALQAEIEGLKRANQMLRLQLSDTEQQLSRHIAATAQRASRGAPSSPSAAAVILQADLEAMRRTAASLREDLVEAERRVASGVVAQEAWERERAVLRTQVGHSYCTQLLAAPPIPCFYVTRPCACSQPMATQHNVPRLSTRSAAQRQLLLRWRPCARSSHLHGAQHAQQNAGPQL